MPLNIILRWSGKRETSKCNGVMECLMVMSRHSLSGTGLLDSVQTGNQHSRTPSLHYSNLLSGSGLRLFCLLFAAGRAIGLAKAGSFVPIRCPFRSQSRFTSESNGPGALRLAPSRVHGNPRVGVCSGRSRVRDRLLPVVVLLFSSGY